MKDEILPILIVIAILVVIYLVMKFINRRLRNRVDKSDFIRKRRL
jgi:flagellar biogenesis protein FliO